MDRRTFLNTISASLILSASPLGRCIASTQEKPFIIGIFPRRNIKVTYKIYQPLAQYISELLNREVRIVSAKNFKHFWRGVQLREFDLVHFNQYHYIVSHELYGYDVILKNSEFHSSNISGAVFVRTDSGINSLQDLKGKTILFGGGPRAMQSYIIATHLLLKAGLKKGDYIEKIAVNPPNALISTYYRQADAAGAGDRAIDIKSVKSKTDTSKLKMLASSKPLPHLPWAVSNELPAETKILLQTKLSELHQSDKGKNIIAKAQLTSLVTANDSEYDHHRKIVKELYGSDYGIELLR